MSSRILIFLIFLLSACRPFESVEQDQNSHVDTIISNPTIVFDVIKIRSSPRIETFWPGEMPEFVFCRSSGVSRTRAYQGISYWKRLGYPIEKVRYDVEGPECSEDTLDGRVVIKIIDNTIAIQENLAVTKVYYETNTRIIRRSSIYVIRAYANRPRLIEHEIGHALGWKHYHRNLHIMHPEYDSTGHYSTGLRYSDYLSQVLDFF